MTATWTEDGIKFEYAEHDEDRLVRWVGTILDRETMRRHAVRGEFTTKFEDDEDATEAMGHDSDRLLDVDFVGGTVQFLDGPEPADWEFHEAVVISIEEV